VGGPHDVTVITQAHATQRRFAMVATDGVKILGNVCVSRLSGGLEFRIDRNVPSEPL
jgi:hypothetical protein